MRRRGFGWVRAAGFAAGAALLGARAGDARAHAPDTYGIGSRAAAMASAVTADATDFSAGYYNPAGLAAAPGLSLSIGYSSSTNHLQMNGVDNDVDSVHGLAFGLVAPGKLFGVLPFAFGIATYLPDDGVSRIKALRQETPRWELYDDRLSVLYLAASLAIRPLPFLEIGGGVAFLAATRGRFSISGRADVLHPYDSQLRHEVDADLTSIRYPHLGARVKIGDLGFLGLAYRGETKLPLSLDASLNGIVDFAGIDVPLRYDLESRTFDAFLPQQVVLGASFQKVRGLRVNADLAWVNWAGYESPTARTTSHLDVTPPPGTPLELPGDPRPTTPIPPGFEDRFVPRLGVEYVWPFAGGMRRLPGETEDRRAVEVPLRAGYVFERSPVPPQTGVTNFVDADRHTFSVGAGVALNGMFEVLPGALRLDLHGQLSVLPERLTKKQSPADFIGDYTAGGSMLSLGATLSSSF